MSWPFETLLGGVLSVVDFFGRWADELKDRRCDDQATAEVRSMKRLFTHCLGVALIVAVAALFIDSLPASHGAGGAVIEQVRPWLMLCATGTIAVLGVAMAFCTYRIWRLEQP